MAEKGEVPYDRFVRETFKAMTGVGVLLVTQGKAGRPNIMTIGWGAIGSFWGKPVFTMMVRPTRYSYQLLGENGDFTINVMPEELNEAVDLCGRTTGESLDKFAQAQLTAGAAKLARAPIIEESLIAYECRTLMTNEVLADRLDRHIRDAAYAAGDFHRIFYGEILCTRVAQSCMNHG